MVGVQGKICEVESSRAALPLAALAVFCDCATMFFPAMNALFVLLAASEASAGGALGLDVGGSDSVIALARRGGIDIVANEASRRQTPTVVAFDGRRRWAGEGALPQRTADPPNAVAETKQLLGRSAASARALRPAPTAALVDSDGDGSDAAGDAVVRVEYLGSVRRFSAVQLLAMLLHELVATAEREAGAALAEAAVAIPAHFGLVERQAVLDAAVVAGVQCVRLLTDGAAVALDYALSRPLGDETRVVCFVDGGYAGVQVSVARVSQSEVAILAYADAIDAGGQACRRPLLQPAVPARRQNTKCPAGRGRPNLKPRSVPSPSPRGMWITLSEAPPGHRRNRPPRPPPTSAALLPAAPPRVGSRPAATRALRCGVRGRPWRCAGRALRWPAGGAAASRLREGAPDSLCESRGAHHC